MSTNKEKYLSPLLQAGSDPFNPELMEYVDNGGKTVGFMYQDTPEEILEAAGAAPIYIRGTNAEGSELAEAFFRQLTCNYTRYTYNEILEGKWDFLTGAVFYNNCDHSRRIYDNWKTIPGAPVYHFIYIPKKRSELSKEFYRAEIQKLIDATEKHFGTKITKEKLSDAIRLYNETRRLQHELYEMQKGEKVYLTGSELLMVMLAGISLPKKRYNELLAKLVAELKEEGPTITPKVRLLYTGGHADSVEFFKLLDQKGANVVVDNTGFGSRACACLIREDIDPLEAIINYYFEEKPAGTRQMETQEERLQRLQDMVGEYKLDGVISARLAMCDLWAFEQFLMRGRLSKAGIPLLELEVDYAPDGQGQIQTRVQAFVESILSRKAQ